MGSIAVVYSSRYGATKKYAEWLAEDLSADLYSKSEITPARIKSYDIVVYGGGIYVGRILGAEFLAKSPPKKLIVFTVGLTDPQTTDYSKILSNCFGEELSRGLKSFHLRGAMDYKGLGFVHRGMLTGVKKFILDKKKPGEFTPEDEAVAEAFGGKVDFTSRAAIKPIVEYISTL